MKPKSKLRAVGIRFTVVAVFMLATLLTASLAIGLQFYFGRILATEAATELYTTASSGITDKWRNVAALNGSIIELLAENPSLAEQENTDQQHLVTLAGVLRRNPLYYGVYMGHADGSFYELVNLNTSETARSSFRATPRDKWILITVEPGISGGTRQFDYMDDSFNIRVSRTEPTDFRVNERPWYTEALNTDRVYASEPYLFAQLGIPGRTVSKRIAGTDSVIAIDMTLSTVSEFLRQQAISEQGQLFIYKQNGQIIASSQEARQADSLPVPELLLSDAEKAYVDSLPPLKVSNETDWPPFDYALIGEPRGYSIDVLRMVAKMTGLELQFINGFSWEQLVEQFRAGELDLIHSILLTDENREWGSHSRSYARLPFAFVTLAGKPSITGIAELAGRKLAIPSGWSIASVVRSRFPNVEVVDATNTLNAIELVLDGSVDAALDNEAILRYIEKHYFISGIQYDINIDLGSGDVPDELHIMAGSDKTQLLEIMDKAIAAIGPAQREYLSRKWLEYDDQATEEEAGNVPVDILVRATAEPDMQEKLLEVELGNEDYFAYAANLGANTSNSLFLGMLVPAATVVEPFMEKVKLSSYITSGFLLFLLPLSWLFATPIVRPIRQLAIENYKVRQRHYDEVQRVPSHIKEIYQLSKSMVEMVEAIKAHELAQRELMDAFIQLIAQAIDDKSAYTGGHCERVPELALMLAEQASASAEAPFRDFKLDDEEQWREYRIAAWLHDCGKITTPEHIVDKGSKLETIYNRIHEVRMRFEALWRDAEIDFLKELLAHPEREAELRETLAQQRERLQDDYAFIAGCNVGGEFLDPEKQERLREIANITWQRHFDDRIGLSPVEEISRPPEQTAQLPATEPLLQDRPEHLIARTHSTDYPPEYEINMDIPEHLYNLGEVYNLSISRGTLTAEDRFKINEHMISTIKMLESLPVPDELKNVPRYASTHHETMRGSGYPRKLPGDRLSIPERILAVADVFEALTASDRPYKKAKPVSVAIDILHKMVQDDHIDRDCFELFVRNGVYMDYAKQFLDPSQIDDVDISKYVDAA